MGRWITPFDQIRPLKSPPLADHVMLNMIIYIVV